MVIPKLPPEVNQTRMIMENQDRPEMNEADITISAEVMNEALGDLYKDIASKLPYLIARRIEDCGWSAGEISKPFFMKVDEAYAMAKTKILFVGRETSEWWGEYDWRDDVTTLRNLYREVSIGKAPNKSPFWRFREAFSQKFDISESEFMKATLWTNLSKIDVGKKRPTGKGFDELMQMFINLLVSEIEIVKPDVVLIMTKDGFYNWHLEHYAWLRNDPFLACRGIELGRKSVLDKRIDRLIAEKRLPEHTYQICHPNALRFKAGGYTMNADELIKTLSDKIHSHYTDCLK